MYAVVDIETTGGNHQRERIIEIGVLIYDGKEVKETFSTLVNPSKDFHPFITSLTGISPAMLVDAPPFEAIAPKLLEILSNHIFVAHGVHFDYGFIRHEFARINVPFLAKTLCTVNLSRKIFPQLKSHSLGKLCTDLDIPITNRHRAFGDAEATVQLLSKIIAHDQERNIEKMLKKQK